MPDFAPRSWTNPLRRPGKDLAQHLSPALLNNLLAVGCAILIKETLNLNKLKNHLGLLLGNRQTKTDSHYRRLTRFFADKTAQNKRWNRSAEAMANYLDVRLYKTVGWSLKKRVLDLGWNKLATRKIPDSPVGTLPGISGR